MRPVIGICVDFVPEANSERSGGGKLCLNWNYADAIEKAGGVPLLIPPQAKPSEVLGLLDGILIPGGNDIDAKNWGEENHPEVTLIAPERFQAEQKLLEGAPADLPVLGICYGCQLINVTAGGSLIQHIPDLPEKRTHTGGEVQQYEVAAGSRLAESVGSAAARGESWHHQSIKDVGEGLKVVARSDDGTIEAVESQNRPWMVGVQWHPERTLDDVSSKALFAGFVQAAAQYRKQSNRE